MPDTLAQPGHARPNDFDDLRDPPGELPRNSLVPDRLRGDLNHERAGGDGLRLPVGNEAQRDGSLGNDVSELGVSREAWTWEATVRSA